MSRLIELLRLAIPLSDEKKGLISLLGQYLEDADIKEIVQLIKKKKADISLKDLGVSPQILKESAYPALEAKAKAEEQRITGYLDKLNKLIEERFREASYRRFSEKAASTLPHFIGMGIVGMDQIKRASALLLFAGPSEPIHMLLLGDPGTGKTEILRSASALHPISSFGLGSGTSSVGLSVTVKGSEVSKGLLPMADKGICAIDELNLMQERDRASLYNAMEKGFITYDKGGKHYKFDSRIRIIAAANPTGDRFSGWTVETLKKQLPFEPALLSRFHLVFLVRKPDPKQFAEITRRIVSQDRSKRSSADENFIKDYVSYAEGKQVRLTPRLENEIVDFVSEIKEKEREYLIEISPRLVKGFVRLAKASARLNLRDVVEKQDVKAVKEIVLSGLNLRN